MFGDDDHGRAPAEGTDGRRDSADAALKIRKLLWLGYDEEAERRADRAPSSAAAALLVPPDTD